MRKPAAVSRLATQATGDRVTTPPMAAARVVTFPSDISYLVPVELVEYFARAGGEPEKALIEWGRRFLHPGGVFVDIGAHIGTYALSYGPEVRETHAFEPQRDTFYRLCGGIALRGNDSIYAHRAALSDEAGETELKVLTSDGGLSSIVDLPTNQHPMRTELVSVSTLDSYALGDVCLIKIDVEGNELAVLRGAVDTIRGSGFPPLLIEVWTDEWYAAPRAAIRAFVTELGYEVTPAPGYDYMWVCEHPSRRAAAAAAVESLPEDGEQKTRLLLTMIVKNETGVIERGLRSILPHVDGYVICDTGSTDGTPALIQRLGTEHNVRGTVHRTEWKNFGHNRTESAERAREWIGERGWDPAATYLLFCDADMTLHVTGKFDKAELREPSYFVLQGAPGNLYPNTRLARADFEWKSHGVTHEFWAAEGAGVMLYHWPWFWLEDGNDGGNRGTKFERDRDLLEAALALDPTNERYMFYLAQTYFDLGEYEKAAEWYEKRWRAGGYQEERMYSRMKQGRALLGLGNLTGVDVLFRAFQEFPHRPDPLFHLAVYYREHGQTHIAELLIERARRVPVPDPAGLFIEQDIYEWRLDWEQAIVGYYTGNKEAGKAAADRVARFRRRGIDHEHMGRNLMHYTEPLTLLAAGKFEVPAERRIDPKTSTLYENSSPTLAPIGGGQYLVGIRLVNYDHANGKWFSSKDADHVIRTRELSGIWSPDAAGPRNVTRLDYTEIRQKIPAAWPEAPVLGLEDQRFAAVDGRVWFTANSWQTPERPGTPQMVLGRLNAAYTEVDHLVPLRWSGAQGIEKNWLLFALEPGLAQQVVGEEPWPAIGIVYGYDPLVILSVDTETGVCTEIVRHQTPWHSARFRGSAGPVQCPGQSGFLLMIHEVTADGDQRIYGQRLMELDHKFKPARLSAPFYIDHRGVEFPLGLAALDTERAIITYGREERESAYAIVAWAELLARLTP